MSSFCCRVRARMRAGFRFEGGAAAQIKLPHLGQLVIRPEAHTPAGGQWTDWEVSAFEDEARALAAGKQLARAIRIGSALSGFGGVEVELPRVVAAGTLGDGYASGDGIVWQGDANDLAAAVDAVIPIVHGATEKQFRAAALINDAVFAQTNETRLLIGVAAVEKLCVRGRRTKAYLGALDACCALVSGGEFDKTVKTSLLQALGNLKSEPIGAMLRREVEASLGVDAADAFLAAYEARGGYTHAGASQELTEAANVAVRTARDLLRHQLAERSVEPNDVC